MKLSDWAKKQGISYLTAYRWFKDGKLPIKAYQSDSGTIIVQDESENLENLMVGCTTSNQSNDIMSLFLKKTVEFSKNNATVEDFAAYILSNFSLKLNASLDYPKYSRNKPKPEEIQKHFQQFLKPKGEKPKPNMLIADREVFDKLAEQSEQSDSLATQEIVEQFCKLPNVSDNSQSALVIQPTDDLLKGFNAAFATTSNENLASTIKSYNNIGAESIVNRIEPTQQPINYTNSINNAFGSSSIPVNLIPSTGAFKPTQKELESVTKTMEQVVKSRKGRKTSKIKKNNQEIL